MNFFTGFRPPSPPPPPIEKPPVGAAPALNGLAVEGATPPNGVGAAPPKAGAALAPPNGDGAAEPLNAGPELAPPNRFAGAAPKAGVELVPPKGVAVAAVAAPKAGAEFDAPKGLAPAEDPLPNGLADAAIPNAGAPVEAPPNKVALVAAAPTGDLTESNGLIGSGVFGCSSVLDCPKTLSLDFGAFTLSPPPNGFDEAGALVEAPNVNPPLLAAGAVAPPKPDAPLAAAELAPKVKGALAALASLEAPNVKPPAAGFGASSFVVTADAPNVKPPAAGFGVSSFAAAPKLKPPEAGFVASLEPPNEKPPLLAGFDGSSFAVVAAVAPKVKPVDTGFGSSLAAVVEALNVSGVLVGLGALSFASRVPPKVNKGFAASSFAGVAPKVKGVEAEASVIFVDAGAKAGADAENFSFFSGSAVFAPKENEATGTAEFDSGPPNLNAGFGSGSFTGTFSGDFGGTPNVNVGALAGCEAVFVSLDDAPKKARNPESDAGFAASAGFAGAVVPNENGAEAPDAAGAVEPNEKGAAVALGAADELAVGIPNEKAGLSPVAAGAGANGDGVAAGFGAAFSSSSIAACTFF